MKEKKENKKQKQNLAHCEKRMRWKEKEGSCSHSDRGSLALNLTDLWSGKGEKGAAVACSWRKVGESGLHGVVERASCCLCPAGWTHTSCVLVVSWVCSVVPFRAGMRLPDSCDSLSLPCLGKVLARCIFSHGCFYYEVVFVNCKPKQLPSVHILLPTPSILTFLLLSACCNAMHPSGPFKCHCFSEAFP